MPGALLGVIKEVYPKRGVIECDRGRPGCQDLWIVHFDKVADNVQTPNLTRRYTRGDKVYFLGTADRATLVCPKREVFEGTATVDFLQPHHGRGVTGNNKQNKEVFFTLQRLTQYFKNSSKADLSSIMKLGDKFHYVAVTQPNGTALKAITVNLIGKEPVVPASASGGGPHRILAPSRHSPEPNEQFEGMIFHVAAGHAYLWCIKLGFVYLPRTGCENLLAESQKENIHEAFQVGDWLAFQVTEQKPKYNCEFRISKIVAAVSKPEGIDCWMGREPSFDTPQFMARGIGIVGAVPTLEYGILYSGTLGRIYFRSEHIRARTMPKPLTTVQFTAMIDQTQGFKDCGWRAIEVAPAPKDARHTLHIRRCDNAVVKSHFNKCSWLVTKEVGEVFASCEKDFWIRIDDGDSLVGKTFSVYIIPYPYGQGSSRWRALYVFPRESSDDVMNQPPMAFPLPPPPIPMPPPPIQQSTEGNGAERDMMSENQIAALEEELLELELSGINQLDMDGEDRVFERSAGTSSLGSGSRGVENGQIVQSRSHSQMNHHSEFPVEVEEMVGSTPEASGTRKVMVDSFCQTNPSKEKELLMKIMNNKDLFTACMVKFPDLVFEICKTESLLPSV